jgi:hypothetical protein
MSVTVPMLLISGSMGTGKTTVLYEVSDLLEEADVAHAAIDLDSLAKMHPAHGEHSDRLMFANLAAVWPVYAAAGADRLVAARVVEDRSELGRYREAVPGAEPIICLLEAPVETMQARLRVREPGMVQARVEACTGGGLHSRQRRRTLGH